MKRIILLLFFVTVSQSQSFKVGANFSIKFVSIETTSTTIFGPGIEPITREKDNSVTAYSFNIDLTADFNKYAAAIGEIGYISGSQGYGGFDLGFYYSTNYLHEKFYLKPGIYAHLNIPSAPYDGGKTIIISSLGGGIRISKKLFLEGAYQIPITKTYSKDSKFGELYKLNDMFSIGIKLVF